MRCEVSGRSILAAACVCLLFAQTVRALAQVDSDAEKAEPKRVEINAKLVREIHGPDDERLIVKDAQGNTSHHACRLLAPLGAH